MKQRSRSSHHEKVRRVRFWIPADWLKEFALLLTASFVFFLAAEGRKSNNVLVFEYAVTMMVGSENMELLYVLERLRDFPTIYTVIEANADSTKNILLLKKPQF